MKIHKKTDNSRTQKQWEELGCKVIEGEKGTEMWVNHNFDRTAIYFDGSQVMKLSKDELEKEKEKKNAKIREEKRKELLGRKLTKEEKEFNDNINSTYFTALQMIKKGYIPVGEPTIGKKEWLDRTEGYNYYNINDCEHNEEKAKEILDNYDRKKHGGLNGLKWW